MLLVLNYLKLGTRMGTFRSSREMLLLSSRRVTVQMTGELDFHRSKQMFT